MLADQIYCIYNKITKLGIRKIGNVKETDDERGI